MKREASSERELSQTAPPPILSPALVLTRGCDDRDSVSNSLTEKQGITHWHQLERLKRKLAGKKREEERVVSLKVKSSSLDPGNKANYKNTCLKGED